LIQIQWLNRGVLEQRVQVMLKFGNSQFWQDYVLEEESQLLKIATTVDWQERQVLVKAAFPLTVSAPIATYEIACGAIERPTLPNPELLTEHQRAKWEVPALNWADLTDASGEYGFSLLNDCKYGYDAQPNQLRLTLLRSPNWPDPEADRGHHQFTYALYPHVGSWQAARTPHHGYELNYPLQSFVIQEEMSDRRPSLPSDHYDPLPPTWQGLHLGAENLILMALKQAEDQPDQWVLRCYEAYGQPAQLQLASQLQLELGQAVDLLERPVQEIKPETSGVIDSQPAQIPPWRIASYEVRVPKNLT
jgi:alpha-mannosidase